MVWKMSKTCTFFDIFLDILHKMNNNLDQEHVKRGIQSFQGKIGTIANDFPGKMTVFPVLTLLFHLYLFNIWFSHLHKNYIYGMRNNGAMC